MIDQLWDNSSLVNRHLDTPRLTLRLLELPFLHWCLTAEYAAAQQWLGTQLPDAWLAQWKLIALRHKDLSLDPDYRLWGLRAICLRDTGAMIGHIGFHTSPGARYLQTLGISNGIELGYEIYPQWRRQGYAGEALDAMLHLARYHQVATAVLSISPENIPSTALALRRGFIQFAEHQDPEDGLEWIYRLNLASPLVQ